MKALSWCSWKQSLLAYGAGTQDGQVYFRSALTGDLEGSVHTGCQVTTMHFSKHCREFVVTTGYAQPPATQVTPRRKVARSPTSPASLAYITRPLSKPFNKTPTSAWKKLTSPSSSTSSYAIVTYRYPSLERVVVVPFAHSVDRYSLRPGRITMSDMSPDGTMLLTAGNEMLALRSIWGRQRRQEIEDGLDYPGSVIR